MQVELQGQPNFQVEVWTQVVRLQVEVQLAQQVQPALAGA